MTATALVPATATLRILRRSFGSLLRFRKGRRNSSSTSPIKTPPVIAALSHPGTFRTSRAFRREGFAMPETVRRGRKGKRKTGDTT
jgi:hypothetical protein